MKQSRKPEANVVRLPLHRGPFYFEPRFLVSPEDWFETFVVLATKALDHANCKAEILPAGDNWQVQVKLQTLIFTIDAEGGMFHLAEPSDEDLPHPDSFGFAEIPAMFQEGLEADRAPKHLADDAKAAGNIGEWLHRAMKYRFEHALKIGAAHFEARLGTEIAGFTSVDRDQLSLFEVDPIVREAFFEVDEKLDSATARESGAKLFSLCVTASGKHATPVGASPHLGVPDRGAPGRAGRPATIDNDALEEIALELLRAKGVPSPKKANWTSEVFAKTIMEKMAERGFKVSRSSVLNKKPLIIQMFKKGLSHSHFPQSNNSKIYRN